MTMPTRIHELVDRVRVVCLVYFTAVVEGEKRVKLGKLTWTS